MLLLLALILGRSRVTARASLHIAAAPAHVFSLVTPHDGKLMDWGRSRVTTRLHDADRQIYHMLYESLFTSGARHQSEAYFRVAHREDNARLELEREGLEGRSPNNELLRITYRLTPEGDGTRLAIAHHWGPRLLIAQLLARSDLWGGIWRLKTLAETGKPSERMHHLIHAGVALVTGLLSLLAFALFWGPGMAIMLLAALLIHEFGHLLAYRLMGQGWGKLIFLPFLGAIAVPRLPFQSQGQAVFAALMGPGLSTLPAIAIALPTMLGHSLPLPLLILGFVMVGLNLFNLIPVEPLDGGIALRSILARLMGQRAKYGLITMGAVIALAGLLLKATIIIVFGVIAMVLNLKTRPIDRGIVPLSSLEIAIAAFSYMAMLTAYLTLFNMFLTATPQL